MNARSLLWGSSVVVVSGALAAGCMTRPVVAVDQTTKTSFHSEVQNQAIDKIDILFSIDNSFSMGDKEEYLRQAVPDLITRLVTPRCVAADGTTLGDSHDDGQCDSGQVEFPPVHDLHIGIVSSSLGPRLGDKAGGAYCGTTAQQDDKAHLLTRTSTGGAVADAQPDGFLAWFPTVAENKGKTAGPGAVPVTDPTALANDFQEAVGGVGEGGCGIESQLESWYRFLVQPDPYDHLDLDSNNKNGTWVGVDSAILSARKDFLRPDSLVAVVVLSDENDSEIDVRANGGTAYEMMSGSFNPPRATSACAKNPADPACMSCLAAPNKGASDPACQQNGGIYSGAMDWGMDGNLRHAHMKQKYGFDPQYPITRYVTGLSAKLVPDRNGEYPPGAQGYVGDAKCQNPLFAASLPDGTKTDASTLCNLPPGSRTAQQIYFAHIGGVPNQLLHFKADDPKASALSDDDWQKILGKDPLNYDYTGIDPHMIESVAPRDGLPPPGADDLAVAPADGFPGRDWLTDQPVPAGEKKSLPVDLQYACTFQLTQPRDCTDPANAAACDCVTKGIAHEQTSPVCDPNNITSQIRAKAYPTIRELLLAKLMQAQGVVSSICPIDVTENGKDDPYYGYRPAVSAIVERLKAGLTKRCLPEKLSVDAQGNVQCLVLATLPTPGSESACDPTLGLSQPEADVLTAFREQSESDWQSAGGSTSGFPDPATLPVCKLKQLVGPDLVNGSCKASQSPGWCYVTGANADGCSQELLFSPTKLPQATKLTLQCITVSTTN